MISNAARRPRERCSRVDGEALHRSWPSDKLPSRVKCSRGYRPGACLIDVRRHRWLRRSAGRTHMRLHGRLRLDYIDRHRKHILDAVHDADIFEHRQAAPPPRSSSTMMSMSLSGRSSPRATGTEQRGMCHATRLQGRFVLPQAGLGCPGCSIAVFLPHIGGAWQNSPKRA